MNNRKKPPSKLLSLMDNSLVQFLISLFIVASLSKATNNLDVQYFKLFLKTIAYGAFFYLATPFTLYWLAYVSSVKLTKLKLGITIFLVGIYSYIFWDSYFFYKQILGELFFSRVLG